MALCRFVIAIRFDLQWQSTCCTISLATLHLHPVWQGVDFGTNHIALRGEASTYFAWIMDSLGLNSRCPFDQQMFIPLASLLIVERKRVHVLVISAKSLYCFAFVGDMLSLKISAVIVSRNSWDMSAKTLTENIPWTWINHGLGTNHTASRSMTFAGKKVDNDEEYHRITVRINAGKIYLQSGIIYDVGAGQCSIDPDGGNTF
uniref:Uncharacterized protein n=1 Tax=Vespula pensylvanica TaxID=30213 RepID=A0A834N6S4_VESPE|nr:hypothetical protein H0235_016320 [Vespula pensylvanica]